ncbi:MAG: OmpA family protein [Gammaproteobacteria bacterium]
MRAIKLVVLVTSIAILTGCGSLVNRTEFDQTVAELRDTDARLAAEDARLGASGENLRAQLLQMEYQMTQLTENLQGAFADYDAQIAQLQGRVRVDMTAHFAVNETSLRDQDKDALREFSNTIADYHPNILITVEGFTDPSGSAEYNKWLGMERAKAVRSYLISSGLSADKVRAVSYGEDKERQVTPGATGDTGASNRRVALVIDYVMS